MPQAFGGNDPPAGAQLQVTPLFAASLVTLAEIMATCGGVVALMEAGGAMLNVTMMGALMVTIALMLLVLSLTEVAMMVTLPP